MALDSDGGSVLGAIGLGREIRKLALNTTVGRSIDLDSGDARAPYASLSPRADCQSMCAFVLLAGVQRTVPREARVMVHQIWLGDRREDPTAANYSAEDLVLVQHDIGSLAQYTIEMGASIDLLNLSLRIPPWEPMHMLTASEISRMHVATDLPPQTAPATIAASPPAAAAMAPLIAPVGTALQPTAISEHRWAVVDHAGTAALARRNPLTIEGEEIGSFDLIVACGGPGTYDVSYAERRHADAQHPLLEAVSAVTMTIGKTSAPLKVVSSQRRQDPDELVTFASATLPASHRCRLCRRRQSFANDRDRQRGYRDRHPRRQYRRAGQLAAPRRALRQTARRPRRIVGEANWRRGGEIGAAIPPPVSPCPRSCRWPRLPHRK